jgi:hypothetical protein
VGGADLASVYAQVVEHLLAAGSEYRPLGISVGSGAAYTQPPTGLRLSPGMLLTASVSAAWGGQVATETATLRVDTGVSHALDTLLDACLGELRPGVALAEVATLAADHLRAARISGNLTLHGAGLGDDGPLLVPDLAPGKVQIETG